MEAPVIQKEKDKSKKIINSKDSKYELELEINNSKLIIKAVTKLKLEKLLYQYEDSVENLYKLDRYFLQFETIEEIKDNIFELLIQESYDLIDKGNKIKLILKPNVGKQTKNIELIFKKIEGNNDTLIDIVIKRLNALESEFKTFKIKNGQFEELTKKEIDSLKIENDNLKNELKQNKESTISLKNENENLKKQLKEYEESLNSLPIKFIGFEEMFGKEMDEKKRDIEIKKYLIGESISTIKYYKEYLLITSGIKEQLTKFNSRTLKFKLIYKSSRDGQNAKDFHYFCDYKGPTVTIIKTKNNVIFGGFLSINWDNKGGSSRDDNSFLFSFNNNKIYKNNKKGYGANFEEKKGPYFGYAINIFEDFNQSKKHCVRQKEDSDYAWKSIGYDYELNMGEEFFDIEEIEVFTIL